MPTVGGIAKVTYLPALWLYLWRAVQNHKDKQPFLFSVQEPLAGQIPKCLVVFSALPSCPNNTSRLIECQLYMEIWVGEMVVDN